MTKKVFQNPVRIFKRKEKKNVLGTILEIHKNKLPTLITKFLLQI